MTAFAPDRFDASGLAAPETSDDDMSCDRQHVHAAFVSDIHLGSKYSQADRFLKFLEQHEMDELYIVGDFLDGWRLRCKWRWPEVYDRIIQRLLEMHDEGTKLFYTPGNHDDFLRKYLRNFGFVSIQDEFVHEAIDGRRFLVMHGDRFDEIEQKCQWLSIVGAKLYDFLLWTNYRVNSVRKLLGMNEWHYCGAVKMKFKGAVRFISDFEATIARHARSQGCDAVICGHIHAPVMQELEDITYCNSGDWVEHCTALLEHTDGTWELTWHFGDQITPIKSRTSRTADSESQNANGGKTWADKIRTEPAHEPEPTVLPEPSKVRDDLVVQTL